MYARINFYLYAYVPVYMHTYTYSYTYTSLRSYAHIYMPYRNTNVYCIPHIYSLLIDALEQSLKHTPCESLPRDLYRGQIVNQIVCTECHTISQREEPYYDLDILIQDCPDLAYSLRQYTSAELLEGESAYACSKCEVKVTARRSTVLATLPPALTFSCSRFKCDKSTKWERQKITARSAFPLLINMSAFKQGSPYVDKTMPLSSNLSSSEPVESYVRELQSDYMVWLEDTWPAAIDAAEMLLERYGVGVTWEGVCRAHPGDMEEVSSRVSSVESFYRDHRRVATIPPTTTDNTNNNPTTSSSTSSNGNAGPGAESMQQHQEGQQEQQHEAKSKHKHKGEGDADEIYQLFAVIMHRGSAHSGHYFAVSLSTYIAHMHSYYALIVILLLYFITLACYIVYKGQSPRGQLVDPSVRLCSQTSLDKRWHPYLILLISRWL